MTFTSPQFLFLFVPLTIIISYRLSRTNQIYAKTFLICSSFAFYSLISFKDLPLLLLSIGGNFALSRTLGVIRAPRWRRLAFSMGIAADLAVLVWYKIHAGGGPVPDGNTIPPGLSFYTFQQIAYLTQAFRRERPVGLLDYSFVISFFPHLLAGPLVQHRDMVAQLNSPRAFRFQPKTFMVGLSFLCMGVAKKVLCADLLLAQCTAFVRQLEAGIPLGMAESWMGAEANILNFYFDYSAYSDMAIGLALMLGLRLPINFYSPLKAGNISELWNRWNISLTRFLRDSVFRPLAGRRHVMWRHSLAIVVSFGLIGLWHVANWSFFLWGVIQGTAIAWYHAQRLKRLKRRKERRQNTPFRRFAAILATQLFFTATALLARTRTVAAGILGFKGMLGLYGWGLGLQMQRDILPPWLPEVVQGGIAGTTLESWLLRAPDLLVLVPVMGVAYFLPNSVELLRRFRPVLDPNWVMGRVHHARDHSLRRLSPGWMLGCAALFSLAMLSTLVSPSKFFLYWGF